jgi:hypothetical protein
MESSSAIALVCSRGQIASSVHDYQILKGSKASDNSLAKAWYKMILVSVSGLTGNNHSFITLESRIRGTPVLLVYLRVQSVICPELHVWSVQSSWKQGKHWLSHVHVMRCKPRDSPPTGSSPF